MTAERRSGIDPKIDPKLADAIAANQCGIGSPTRARTWDLRINSPSGHRPESRASQRSWPKQPVIFSPSFRSFPRLIRRRDITDPQAPEKRVGEANVSGRLRTLPVAHFLVEELVRFCN